MPQDPNFDPEKAGGTRVQTPFDPEKAGGQRVGSSATPSRADAKTQPGVTPYSSKDWDTPTVHTAMGKHLPGAPEDQRPLLLGGGLPGLLRGDVGGPGTVLGDAYNRATNWDLLKPGLMQAVSPRASLDQVVSGAKRTGEQAFQGVAGASTPVIAHRVLDASGALPKSLQNKDMYAGEPSLRGLETTMPQAFFSFLLGKMGGGPEEAPMRGVNVKGPGEVAPEMTRPQAYPVGPRATPIGPRSGLMLPGDVAPPDTSYAGVDALRAKLTSPEAQAVRGVSEPEGLNNLATTSAPPVDRLRNFMTSNPSALDRLPKPQPTALDRFVSSNPSALGRIKPVAAEAAESEPSAVKGVSKPPEGAEAQTKAPEGIPKVKTPPAKPVAPAKTTSERQLEHRLGDYADSFNEDNLQHQKILNMTNDRLAEEANKAKIDGRTDWTENDMSRGKGGGKMGASVRGKLMEKAASGGGGKSPDTFLGRANAKTVGGDIFGQTSPLEKIDAALAKTPKLVKSVEQLSRETGLSKEDITNALERNASKYNLHKAEADVHGPAGIRGAASK